MERLGIKDAQDLAQDLLSGRIDLQLRLAPDESIQTSEKDLHLDLRDFHHHPVPDEAPGLAVALQDGQAKRLITVAPILNIVTKRLPEIVIGVSSGTSASNNGPLVMTVIIDSFQVPFVLTCLFYSSTVPSSVFFPRSGTISKN